MINNVQPISKSILIEIYYINGGGAYYLRRSGARFECSIQLRLLLKTAAVTAAAAAMRNLTNHKSY